MPNENNRSLTPNLKGDGFAQRIDVSAGTEMPPGILSMTPLSKMPTIPTGTTQVPPVSKLVSAALPGIGPAARNVRDVIRRK